MADKQYSRKLADEDHGFEEERDPLAELARVVGYGDYARQHKTPDDDPDTGAELEDELLRALGSRDDAQAGSVFAGNRPRRDDDAPMPESDAADEADAMTLSLEEDLLRELEGGGEPAETPVDATAELDETVEPPAQEIAERTVPSGDAAEFELTDTNVTAESAAAEEGESEGFVFPSADEIEVDADFAGQSWKPSGFGEGGSQSVYRDVPQIDSPRAGAGWAVNTETAPTAADQPADDIPADREDPAENETAVAANPSGGTEVPATADAVETDERLLDPETEAGMIFETPPGDGEIAVHPETDGPRDADDASSVSAASQPVEAQSPEPTIAPGGIPDEAVMAIEADAARSLDFNLRQAEIDPGLQDADSRTIADDTAGEDEWLQESAPAAEAAAVTANDAAEVPALRATDDDAVEALDETGNADGIDGVTVAQGPNEDETTSAPVVAVTPMEPENATPEVEAAGFADDTGSDADDPIPDLDDVLREITAEYGPDVAEEGGSDLSDAVAPEHVESQRTGEPVEQPEEVPVGFAAGGESQPEPVEAVDETAEPDDLDGIENEPPAGSLAAVAASAAIAGDTAEGVFDPASITAHDENVDAVADLDVPALPDDDPAPAVSSEDDAVLDYDVDAALAQLVNNSNSAVRPAAVQPVDETGYTAADAITGGTVAAAASAGGAHGAEAEHPAFADHFDPDELERALDAHLNEPEAPGTNGDAGSAVAAGGVAAASAPPLWQNWKALATGVAVIAVIAGTVITFGFDNSNTPETGAPRIIAADTGPVKQKPKNPGGKVVPNQNKIVYNQVDGTSIDPPTQKTLISSDESPIDVVQRTLRPDLPRDASMASGEPDGVAPAEASGTASATETNGNTAEASAKSQERLASGNGQAAPTRALPNGVIPHYVKTMTVNANGKLVVADPQPVSSPAQAETQSASESASASPASSGQAETPASTNAPEQAATAKQTPLNGPAPLPVARPVVKTQQAASTAPAATQPASTPAPAQSKPSAATSQPTATASNSQAAVSTDTAPSYFVQISSQPTEAGAKASYSTLNHRYASLLDGRGVDIQRANIEGKGTYYRVRIPASSRDDAVNLCQSYKAAGGSCFVAR